MRSADNGARGYGVRGTKYGVRSTEYLAVLVRGVADALFFVKTSQCRTSASHSAYPVLNSLHFTHRSAVGKASTNLFAGA